MISLRRADVVRIFILGEIVGASFFAIFQVQCEDPGFRFFVCGLSSPYARVLFFAGVPCAAFLALVAASLLARRIPPLLQVAKFISVGVSNTAIDWGILNLLIAPVAASLFGITDIRNLPQLHRVAMKGLSFAAATLNSYFWNKTWTFERRGTAHIGKEAAQFYLFTLVGLAINMSAFWVFQSLGPKESRFWIGVLAPGFATLLSAAWDFLSYKLVVFKKP